MSSEWKLRGRFGGVLTDFLAAEGSSENVKTSETRIRRRLLARHIPRERTKGHLSRRPRPSAVPFLARRRGETVPMASPRVLPDDESLPSRHRDAVPHARKGDALAEQRIRPHLQQAIRTRGAPLPGSLQGDSRRRAELSGRGEALHRPESCPSGYGCRSVRVSVVELPGSRRPRADPGVALL